jgi:hypothetical protein
MGDGDRFTDCLILLTKPELSTLLRWLNVDHIELE